MKKSLKRIPNTIYHYKDGVRVEGVHDRITGNVIDISGNVSYISGNVSDISGNLNDCEITDEDRKKGIDINDLV